MCPGYSYLPKLQTKAKHYTVRGEAYMAYSPLEVQQPAFF